MFLPIVTVSASNNSNLNAGSGLAGINASYGAGNNFYFNMGTQYTYSGKFTEFWDYSH